MASDDKNLLVVKSPSEVEAEEKEVLESRQINASARTGLSALIRQGFWEAKQARTTTIPNGMSSIDKRIEESKLQVLSQYDTKILAAIREGGGSEVYDPLTSNKCQIFESWVRDVMSPADDKPWGIEPTPLPEMTEDVEAMVEEKAVEYYDDKIPQELKESESPEVGNLIGDKVFQEADEIRDRVNAERMQEAKERAERMEVRIHDQLVEGGFMKAFNDFVEYVSRMPIGIIKGPIYKTVRKVHRRLDEDTGEYISEVQMKKVRHFYTPRTEDMYFSQGMLNMEDGDIYEIVRFQASSLQKLKGTPGYIDAEIDKVLSTYGGRGLREWTNREWDDNSPAGIPNQTNSSYNGEIDAVDYWGMKQGKDLKTIGVKGIADENIFYAVHCMQVADHVILAELNPDIMGRKPYHGTSFLKLAGYIYGEGIPERLRTAQRDANVAHRAWIDNIAIAAGPQAMVMPTALCDGEDITSIYRGKIWQLKERQYGKDARPVHFFQPDMQTEPLIKSMDKSYNDGDRDTGIPRYVQGDQSGAAKGAAGTARGLSMLMSAASKNVKNVIRSMDEDVIGPIVEMMYDINMLDSEVPEEEKGDFVIRTKGALSLVVREQLQATRMEFINIVGANPKVAELIGPEKLAMLIREVSKDLKLPFSLVPSDTELKAGRRGELKAQFEEGVDMLFRAGYFDEQTKELILNPEQAAAMLQGDGGGGSTVPIQQPAAPQPQTGAA